MGLRAKLAIAFFLVLLLAIAAVSSLEINRTMRVMVSNLGDSGQLLVNEVFEQMRKALDHPDSDPIAALRNDGNLRSFLRWSEAFGKGVVYVRIAAPDGTVILAASPVLNAQKMPEGPSFGELERETVGWWPATAMRVLWLDRTYELSRPVELNSQPFAFIKVGLSTALIAAEAHRSVEDILAIAATAIILSLAGATLVGGVLLRPVATITAGIESLVAGHAEAKLAVGGNDELRTLADKFNQLSQRIRADRTQWENERGQFFNIFRSITDAVILLDAEGLVLFANPEAQGRLGLPAGGLASGKPLTLLLGKEHALARMIETVYAAGTEVHDVALELPGNAASSRLLVSISSLGSGPEPPGLLVIVRDLQPVRELESVVDYSGRLARLGGLISGVAHQIRNPLNVMSLQLQLLSQDSTNGKPVDARIESMRREVRRLDQAITGLMRFMRPEELRLSNVAINEMLTEIGSRIDRPNLFVVYQLDPRGPIINADRVLLDEALRNIVDNAVQAMVQRGGNLTLVSALSTDGSIEISVIDEGDGIAAEDRERIFQLYFTTRQSGNGLGLPLALRAIDLHHGTMNVESTSGTGTTIRIHLPVRQRIETGTGTLVDQNAN